MPDDWERVNTGASDPHLLSRALTVAEEYEPLVVDASLDRSLNPEILHLHLDAGIHSESGRFDVRWTAKRYYSYHYTEGDQFNYRYDRHPHPDALEKHFHDPPAAPHDQAVPSYIQVETVRLVTLAVLQLWRDAVEADDLSLLQQPNSA